MDEHENIDEKEEQNDASQLNNRINKLYGIEEEEEPREIVEYDPKDLENIRKKLLILLMIIVVFVILFIIILLNPFKSKTKEPNYSDNEDVEDVEPPVSSELPLGEIETSNNIVMSLNSKISFSLIDFYNMDPFELFKNNSITSNDIPDFLKIHFLSKTDDFYNIFDEIKLEEYIKTCDTEGITLDNNQVNTVIEKTLGPNVNIANGTYLLLYYSDTLASKRLSFTKNDNNYVITCNTSPASNEITKYFQQKLEKAIKTEEGIELYQRIVFIKESGVYKDPNFTNLITNDINVTYDSYITGGAVYKFKFIENEKDYYLSSIELVQED